MNEAYIIKSKVTTMEKERIAAEVNALLIEKIDLNAAQIRPKASIAKDLGIDSLALCELITDAEKKFLINIPDEDVDNIITVEDLTKYIVAHVS